MKKILRWIAMPFAAIAGSLIAYFFVSLWIKGNNFGFQMYNGVEVGSMSQILLAIAAQFISGAAFVACGSITAPSHQRTCSIVLATIITIITIATYTFTLIQGFSFLVLTHHIATIIGAIYASWYVHNSINVLSEE